MKITLIFYFTLIVSNVFSQQIFNSDFEIWINQNEASGWTSSVVNVFTFVTADKTNDSYSGEYAAELKTNQVISGDILPGMIQLGQIDMDKIEIIGGIPFSSKPTAFEVFLKYEQHAADSLIVFCYLTKYDNNSHQRIQLGGSYYTFDENISKYTSFLFPIYYVESGTPDTINLGFFSSAFNRTIGTTLWVDKLNLLYGNYFLPPLANIPENVTDSSFIATWAGADYSKGYYLDVASDMNFTNFFPGFNNKYIIDTTKIYVQIPDTSIKKVYYRIKSDYDSVITEYSDVMEFAVPYSPICKKPTNVTSKYFIAEWNKIPTADYYILDVAKDSNFTDYVNGYYYLKTDSNQVNVIGLEKDTKYYFRVRAGYFGLISNYSNTIELTTPVSESNDLIQFFMLPDKIIIYTNEEIYGSEFSLFETDGRLFYKGILNFRYTEIPLKSIKILIFIAQTKKGNIKHKIGISDMGGY